MARVTVEDCVEKVPNRFELVMLAAQRAREVSSGAPLTLDRDNDKNPVVALREIADSTVGLDELQENLIRGLQRHNEFADDDDDDDEVIGDAYDGVSGPVMAEGEAVDEADVSAAEEETDPDGEGDPVDVDDEMPVDDALGGPAEDGGDDAIAG